MNDFYLEPPQGLFEKILERIHKEERFLGLRRTIIFSITLAGSLAGFIPSFKAMMSDFGKTGFINFFSLAFSDFSTVSAHWQSFAMILLETLPAVSLALFLAVVLTFLQSVKSLSKNIKIIRLARRQLAAN